MTEQFANNASSTLNGAINDSTTTIVVTDASEFPSSPEFRLMLGSDSDTGEIVLVTGVAGNTLTVARGQEGTTAASWPDQSEVTHILTAGAIEEIRTQWVTEANTLVTGKTVVIGDQPLTVQRFGYVSDSLQTFTVPDNVTTVQVKMWGPGGGSGNYNGGGNGGGGSGGFTTGFLSVTPGETLYIAVGSGGKKPVAQNGDGGLGGWPGGGFGTRGDASGGGGGGFAGIFSANIITQGNALMVAGGGGGSTGFGNYSAGAGGGLTGGSGTGTSGKGGTQSAGGLNGNNFGANSTTIAAGSNGQTLPQATINVASTTGFPSSGTLLVTTSNGQQIVGYTGTTATTFTGCTLGTGTMSTGGAVFLASAGGAFRGGVAFIDTTTSTFNDCGGGGSGYFGGGAGQGDGTSGGGGSGYIHPTRVSNGITTTGSNGSGSTAAQPPATNDSYYVAGVGLGGAATGAAPTGGTDGGDGYVVFVWGGQVSLDPDSLTFNNNSTLTAQESNLIVSSDGYIKIDSPSSIHLETGSDLITLSSGTQSVNLSVNSLQIGRLYQTGAWVVGLPGTHNDTSSEAQAGITGPLINISNASGSATSVTNQALLYNISGSARLQGHSEVRFEVGTNVVGYFDSNRTLRISSTTTPTTNVGLFGTTFPIAGISSLYSISSTNNEATFLSTSAFNFTIIESLNAAAGSSSTTGIRLASAGTSAGVTGWDGQGVIEQVGPSTSALVFSKVAGNATGRDTTGRIYQSGAWAIGSATNNDTSSEAQAGLTGPLINLSSSSGTATSTANQVLLYNLSGSARLQAHSDIRFEVGTNLAGFFDSNRVFRIGKNPTTTSTISATTFPRATNDVIYSCSTSEESFWGNFNQSASSLSAIGTYNTAAGGSSSNGLTLFAMGASGWMPAYTLNGVIEQTGSATSALVFGKVLGDGGSRGVTGRIWQSGAWNIGDATHNDTSSEAQAGLTGSLLNLAPITGGSLSSTSNQGLLYNSAGTITLQGHTGHSFIANTTTVASTSATKFITNVGRRLATNIRTANYTITAGDHIIIVGGLSSSITITLPPSPTAGDTYIVKDQGGSAASFNIILSGNGNNIDGVSSYTMNTNYQSTTVVFANGSWSII